MKSRGRAGQRQGECKSRRRSRAGTEQELVRSRNRAGAEQSRSGKGKRAYQKQGRRRVGTRKAHIRIRKAAAVQEQGRGRSWSRPGVGQEHGRSKAGTLYLFLASPHANFMARSRAGAGQQQGRSRARVDNKGRSRSNVGAEAR